MGSTQSAPISFPSGHSIDLPKPIKKEPTTQVIYESIDELKEKLTKAAERLDHVKYEIEQHQIRNPDPDHKYGWILRRLDDFHVQIDARLEDVSFRIK